MKKLLSVFKSSNLENINKNDLYKDLYANFPDSLFLINLNGEIIDCNESLETLTGVTKENLLYSYFGSYIHPDDLSKVNKYFKYARNGKIQEKEFRVLKRNGKVHYVSATVVPAKIKGKILGVYGVAKDITEKKYLETALKTSQIRFESLIQNSSDVIAVIDQQGIIKYQSSAVKKFLGYEPSDLLGTNAFDTVYKEDLEKAKEVLSNVLKTESLREKAELRLIKKDGTLLFFEVYVTNLLEDESVNGIVINYRDISERKSFESEI